MVNAAAAEAYTARPMVTPAPNTDSPLRRTLRRNARVAAVTTWTAACINLMRLRARGLSEEDRYEMIDLSIIPWSHGAMKILGIEIDIVARDERAFERRGRMFVVNHRSALDLFPIMSTFGGHFLANHKTKTAPVAGLAAVDIGTVFVDRSSKQSGVAAIRAMRSLLQKGRPVTVFPEGTTYPGDDVHTFHAGAFLAAKGLDVDIVPVGLAYPPGTEFVEDSLGEHAKNFLERERLVIRMAVGAPIPIAGGRGPTEEEVRARVQELVHVARRGA